MAGDTANVRIASSKDYEVCIGGKVNLAHWAHTKKADCEADTANGVNWHAAKYYGYKSGNNTATITADWRGTSGGVMAPRFANQPALTWAKTPHVNDWPVARYEVRYLDGNIWKTLNHQ